MTQNQQQRQQTVRQFQIAEEAMTIAAQEAEERKNMKWRLEIEKVVKAQKEAQYAAEVADSEEQITTKNAGQRAAGVVRQGVRRESGS